MIEKTIHYCWFGNGQLDEKSKKCIESWKIFCPEYKIVEWNESNFNIHMNPFVEEAYQKKKWAFITDYVRLYVLYNYGGIYMDTDVELLKNIDCFLNHKAFSGFENNMLIPTGIMASEKNNEWIKYLLSYYDNKHFINTDNSLNTQPNTGIITNMTLEKYNLVLNNEFQILNNEVAIYPHEYFCPKSHITNDINITENTYCIHHFNGSWISKQEKRKHQKIMKYTQKYANIPLESMSFWSKIKRTIEHIYSFEKL
jgi:mannosyltransferase OCH1-like enzyme